LSEYILEMKNICKTFPGVQALDNVTLKVRKGTVHALMGENGAGKSTLMKILIGLYKEDSGEIIFDNEKLHSTSLNYVLNKGISMIYQELNPIPYLTVAENIYVGREPKRTGVLLNKRQMLKDTQQLLDFLEIDYIKPTERLKDLTVAKKQMVEIAKAISYNSKLIIMDEPTSSLIEKECEHLFKIVESLKNEGVTFIFITHKMDEVFRIADEITVLRDGQFIATKPVSETNMNDLIYMMVGREITQMFPKQDSVLGDVLLSVRNLTINGEFQNVSFDAHRGEILGLAGLVGAGRTEVMEAIFGYKKLEKGEIFINGKKVYIKSPADAIKHKMALLTEDRKGTGLYPTMSVRDNIVMPSIKKYTQGMLLQKKKILSVCEQQKKLLSLKTPSMKQIVSKLSGGNQQKVLVSRWLLTEPEIIILDEPTRGIDVGAKSEIHKFISDLVISGKCVIMISSEMPEILGMSDRIIVMHEGDLVGVLNRNEATQSRILQMATGIVQ